MIKYVIALLTLICTFSTMLKAQTPFDDPKNHACLHCHSTKVFSFLNEVTNTQQKRLMNPYYIIDTTAIRLGVHKTFDCTDCHSYDYTTYPHDGKLKLQPMSSCLDCHGGDPTYAKYQFEKIDEEFKKSAHYEISGEIFSCASCHDQHIYRPVARNAEDIKDLVTYSNNMCLSCHNNEARYELIAGQVNPVIVQTHSWLPNQEIHFKSIRCIDCHTTVVDSLMISHHIMKKTEAVKNCAECHNKNSMLKASLYKYENLRSRTEGGGIKSILSNETYIIGAQQFPLLQKLSIIILLFVVAGISIHLVIRKIKK